VVDPQRTPPPLSITVCKTYVRFLSFLEGFSASEFLTFRSDNFHDWGPHTKDVRFGGRVLFRSGLKLKNEGGVSSGHRLQPVIRVLPCGPTGDSYRRFSAAPNRATPIARPRRSFFWGGAFSSPMFFSLVFLPKTRGGGGSDFCLQMAAVPVRRNHSEEDKN
jgi:hypothetical protein